MFTINTMSTSSNQSSGFESVSQVFVYCHKEGNHKSIPYDMFAVFLLSCLSITRAVLMLSLYQVLHMSFLLPDLTVPFI